MGGSRSSKHENKKQVYKDRTLLDSFYNKSVANLMRLDDSDFEESEDSFSVNTVGFDDMINMERMDEDMVLKNLKERYNHQTIYVSQELVNQPSC